MFEIVDGNIKRVFESDPITAMRWVFLTESLIGVVAHCDDELALILKIATGLESDEIKENGSELTAKLIKGVVKAISQYSDERKKEIYNRIFEGFKTRTPEGGVLMINCDTLDTLLMKPSNFYIIVYNCLKHRYEGFFPEAVDIVKNSTVVENG